MWSLILAVIFIVFVIYSGVIEIPLLFFLNRHAPQVGDIYRTNEYVYSEEYVFIKILAIERDIVTYTLVQHTQDGWMEYGTIKNITTYTLESEYVWMC